MQDHFENVLGIAIGFSRQGFLSYDGRLCFFVLPWYKMGWMETIKNFPEFPGTL